VVLARTELRRFSAEEKIRIVIEGRWISLRAPGIPPVGPIRTPEASPIPWEAPSTFWVHWHVKISRGIGLRRWPPSSVTTNWSSTWRSPVSDSQTDGSMEITMLASNFTSR